MQGKTAFITGASRGIGAAIAIKLASLGVNVAVVAKSVEEDPRLGGTIHSVAEKINAAGGNALPIQCDIRDEQQIIAAVAQTVEKFGGIDFVINNASAISLTDTEKTESKRFDLMHDINVRGTFLVTKHCLPYLRQSSGAHILTLSPPLDISPHWIAPFCAYSLSKFNMSMMAMGWSVEFKKDKIASNALWPVTTIATAAVKNLLGGEQMALASRTPAIIADAAAFILGQSTILYTGKCWLDEDLLMLAGVHDFAKYAVTPGAELQRDLYVSRQPR